MEGIKDRQQLDDLLYSINAMFQTLVLDYNNELIHVKLPPDAEELDDYLTLDATDSDRMKILWDC